MNRRQQSRDTNKDFVSNSKHPLTNYKEHGSEKTLYVQHENFNGNFIFITSLSTYLKMSDAHIIYHREFPYL
jgi:hypothetical protein